MSEKPVEIEQQQQKKEQHPEKEQLNMLNTYTEEIVHRDQLA